jgi:hypothetical protein
MVILGKLEKSSMQAHSCESGLRPEAEGSSPPNRAHCGCCAVERRVNRICFHGIDPTASAHYARRGVFATINDNYDNSANPAIALRLQSTRPAGRIAKLWIVLGGSVELFWMSYTYHIRMLPVAIPIFALLIGMSGPAACANETGVQSGFEEHRVEFYNHDVKLSGSLLLPRSEVPGPAVVFVHGAGRQTREPYREAGEYFESQGIAALIYDKRGVGESGGTYESHRPYENLANDALSAIAFLKQRREIAPAQIGIWGLSQGTEISAAAASRSEDIQFVVGVGAEVADGMMFYYRDNLFRNHQVGGRAVRFGKLALGEIGDEICDGYLHVLMSRTSQA